MSIGSDYTLLLSDKRDRVCKPMSDADAGGLSGGWVTDCCDLRAECDLAAECCDLAAECCVLAEK